MSSKCPDGPTSSSGTSGDPSKERGGGDLSQTTSTEDMQKILECPCCHEVMFGTIYLCKTGHNICSSCRKRINKCPLCNFNYLKDTRNFALESIVDSSKFKCEFFELGCSKMLSGEMLKPHMKTCRFRPIQCHFGNLDGCGERKIGFLKYPQHILDFHHFKETTVNTQGFFSTQFSLREASNGKRWSSVLMKFDNNCFASYMFRSNNNVYAVLTAFAEEEVAKKYHVRILFEPVQLGELPKFEATIPVLSMRTSQPEMRNCPHLCVSETQLRLLTNSVETTQAQGEIKLWRWYAKFKIMMRNSLQPY